MHRSPSNLIKSINASIALLVIVSQICISLHLEVLLFTQKIGADGLSMGAIKMDSLLFLKRVTFVLRGGSALENYFESGNNIEFSSDPVCSVETVPLDKLDKSGGPGNIQSFPEGRCVYSRCSLPSLPEAASATQ